MSCYVISPSLISPTRDKRHLPAVENKLYSNRALSGHIEFSSFILNFVYVLQTAWFSFRFCQEYSANKDNSMLNED